MIGHQDHRGWTLCDAGWMALSRDRGTAAQAVDGLGLAESTPGPLIMVLQFVGFMAGWQAPVAGWSAGATAVLCALLTTWATFLPSLTLVLVGAPYIARLRQVPRLSAALAGILAAVTGVILHLGLTFAFAAIAGSAGVSCFPAGSRPGRSSGVSPWPWPLSSLSVSPRSAPLSWFSQEHCLVSR